MHYPPYRRDREHPGAQPARWRRPPDGQPTLGKWFQSAELPGIRVLGPASAPICKDQAHLPVPSAAQSRAARSAFPRAARRTRLRGEGRHSPQWSGVRYGRDQPDVVSERRRTQRGQSIRCSSLPGLKRTALPGVMVTSAPVRGLRPMPVLRGTHVEDAKAAQLDAFAQRPVPSSGFRRWYRRPPPPCCGGGPSVQLPGARCLA